MKKANFNMLQNLPTPESWIENAVAIPEREAKAATVPFWRRRRVIAAAASLALVTALSVVLYLSMGNKSPVAVKPASTRIVWSTDENGETVATEVVIVPDDHLRDSTQPAEQNSPVARLIERLFGTSSTESGSSPDRPKPTEIKPVTPTAGADPTEGGTHELPTEEETDAPTEDAGEVILNGPGGADYTLPAPTAAPMNPSEATFEPDDPTEPAVPKPTQSRYKPSVRLSVSVYTVSMINKEGGVVYCRIFDSSGNSYGDSDRYSDQHLATLALTYDSRTLSYSPRDHGILPEDGYYGFEFYTRSGRSLITGYAYLSAT